MRHVRTILNVVHQYFHPVKPSRRKEIGSTPMFLNALLCEPWSVAMKNIPEFRHKNRKQHLTL